MSLLKALERARALRPVDLALAESLRRLDPDTPDAVLAAAALASLAVAEGHAGFDPGQPQRLVDVPIAWPEIASWGAALEASRWVARPARGDVESAPDAPLVFEHGLVYLRRYREYERRLVDGLRRIGRAPPQHCVAGEMSGQLAPLFRQLFPDAASGDDAQSHAAAAALRHSLLLVTGGPGTGKTTTITRMLVLLAAQAREAGAAPPRISLAAPTGRAAERMAESVRHALQALPALGVDEALCAQLPAAGTTLHRLLGTIPDSPAFRHHADNPLPFDVVVVDEASMIDLPLMAKLVEAVPDGARLVLLGDPDQLPSVEAGDVLAGILQAAGDGTRLPPADAEALQPLLGPAPALPSTHPSTSGHPSTPPPATNTSPAGGRGRAEGAGEGALAPVDTAAGFPGRRVHLRRGWRQSESLQLAPLANAVRDGDSDTALSLLRDGTLSGVHFHDSLADPLRSHRETLLAHWQSLADAATPADALALANRLRILTAVREGPQGARTLNARIETLLAEHGLGQRRQGQRHFHGQLLIVTENSYRHRLFNGDIGICHRGPDDSLMAWFPGDDPARPRAFHPAALPAHDSAFAMTVHKAQGSEFDEVWLVLPERFNRVLSRELVYTGMTRARTALHLIGHQVVLESALRRLTARWSGLGARLGR